MNYNLIVQIKHGCQLLHYCKITGNEIELNKFYYLIDNMEHDDYYDWKYFTNPIPEELVDLHCNLHITTTYEESYDYGNSECDLFYKHDGIFTCPIRTSNAANKIKINAKNMAQYFEKNSLDNCFV